MQSQEREVRRYEVSVRPRQTDLGPEEQDGAQALAPDINTAVNMTVVTLETSALNRTDTEKTISLKTRSLNVNKLEMY